MNRCRLVLRSLAHYWRTSAVVAFGVAVATAVIVGSLVVGESIRGSLRETALQRLGAVDHAVLAARYFRAQLSRDLAEEANIAPLVRFSTPIIHSAAAARHPETGATVPEASVLGVEPEFWGAHATDEALRLSGRDCAINSALADDLRLQVGDYLLVTAHRQGDIAADTLFARRGRQDAASTMRVHVKRILPAGGAGDFRLDAQSAVPRNVFIGRSWLADRLGVADAANVMLLASAEGRSGALEAALEDGLSASCTTADYGLRLVRNTDHGYLSLESVGFVLSDALAEAALQAADDCGARAGRVSVYLANGVSAAEPDDGQLAYAMVAAVEPLDSSKLMPRRRHVPKPGDIWLDSWAHEDLRADLGSRLRVSYMMPTPEGSYPTAETELTLRAIVPMLGPAVDSGLVPGIEGMTDALEMDKWNVPFPVDFSLITDRDEQYWDRYRAAPKAFVSLQTVRSMWQSGPQGTNADWITSVRIAPPEGTSLAELEFEFTSALMGMLSPRQSGFRLLPLREQALQAAKGTSDFSQLFLGLSMFLVLSGVGLAGMMLRLSVQQRATHVGTMLAVGWDVHMVRRVLLVESGLLVLGGTALGVPGGVAYASAIIRALGSWWSGAAGAASILCLYVPAPSLLIGAGCSLLIGLLAVLWSVRSLGRLSTLQLLAGPEAPMLTGPRPHRSRASALLLAALIFAAVIALLSISTDLLNPQSAFLGVGVALLVAALSGFSIALSRNMCRTGATASLQRLSLRNAAVASGRSLLVFGLLASATFVIVTVAANTRDFSAIDHSRRDSGTGGFSLLATSTMPLLFDPATATGRGNLGFTAADEAVFKDVDIISLRADRGEDISCLNLARPSRPRIVAVSETLIAWDGFSFTDHVNSPDRSPWRLLLDESHDDTIPAIGDAASVRWTLHSGLGQLYDLSGREHDSIRLRFVGLLDGSIFQRELLISEEQFGRLHPTIRGPSYFLIRTPPGREDQVAAVLRRNLGDMGLEVRKTTEVLNQFMRVQNTYLSMFLALGGLGLLLGTVGLVTVMLREAVERRSELALMMAAGFTRRRLAALLMLENGALVLGGLIAGTLAALVAVAPQLGSAAARVNWQALLCVLGSVLLTGLLSAGLCAHAITGGRLLADLRSE